MTEPKKKQTFAGTIYEAAVARASTPEGEEELKGVSKDKFLAVVKALTDGIDSLDTQTSLHEIMMGVSFLGSVILATMQHNKQRLENEPPAGSA